MYRSVLNHAKTPMYLIIKFLVVLIKFKHQTRKLKYQFAFIDYFDKSKYLFKSSKHFLLLLSFLSSSTLQNSDANIQSPQISAIHCSGESEMPIRIPLLELRVVEYFLKTCVEKDVNICEPLSKVYKGYKDFIDILKNDAKRLEKQDIKELEKQGISSQMLTKLRAELNTVDKKTFTSVLKKKIPDQFLHAYVDVDKAMLVGAGFCFWRDIDVIDLINTLKG